MAADDKTPTPTTATLPPDPEPLVSSNDDATLAALGYTSQFQREFTLFSSFSVAFAILGLLPSVATTMLYGMGYAGTAGMTWGWLLAMVGIQCVAFGMAEICSAMPTSGGLYYAAAVLAPPRWGPLAAWLTGWSNWLGQVLGPPSVNYGVASMVLAAASVAQPDFVPQPWQTFVLTAALMAAQCGLAALPTKRLAQVNEFGSVFNMVALVVVLVLIPATTDRVERGLSRFASSEEVWGTVYQGTEWPQGVAVLMSFSSVIWTLSGYDAPFHLAEECSNADIASPRAIVMTSVFGGLFGWFLQLVVAYTVVDIGEAIGSQLGQPFAAYLQQCLPQKVVLTVLALTIVAGFMMGLGCMISASRVTFAYARDDCFPWSRLWKQVNSTTKTPVNAVLANGLIGLLALLLVFGGQLAIGSLFSIGAIAQYVAFTIPIFIRVFFVGNKFTRGPWHLGRFSLPVGWVACGFVTLMLPLLCFPAYRAGWPSAPLDADGNPDYSGEYYDWLGPLTAQNMNWTCVVYGGPMTLVMVWWVLGARKWFKGPKINVEHMIVVGSALAARVEWMDGVEVSAEDGRADDGLRLKKSRSGGSSGRLLKQ